MKDVHIFNLILKIALFYDRLIEFPQLYLIFPNYETIKYYNKVALSSCESYDFKIMKLLVLILSKRFDGSTDML